MPATPESRDWEPPEELRDFRVLAPLGEGGMGKVYLARELGLDRIVALKFMTPDGDRAALDRFRFEARALARLQHPNVVGVYRVDETPDGHPFIAYEYVRGESLDRMLLPVRWQTALAILVMTANALGAAHAAHLLHRDVKPSNVMITPSGEVKLIDFGLAASADVLPPIAPRAPSTTVKQGGNHGASRPRRNSSGKALGTPRYWAPEQWMGKHVTAATDVYGVGLIGYELLTGRLPFGDLPRAELMRALTLESEPSLDSALGPRVFLDVIERCLRRDPSERFPSSVELAAALEHVASVFLHSLHGDTRIGSDEDLVAASWARSSVDPIKIAHLVYLRLVKRNPEIRELLPVDLSSQEVLLAKMLDICARSLRSPDKLVPMLRELGQRHAVNHVEPRHLDAFGVALRRALSELDPEWNPELDHAWEHAYAFIAASMREGMLGPPPEPGVPASTIQTPTVPVLAPPRTSYARVEGAWVAYQVFGQGPPNLVLLPSALTQVEATWTHPSPVALLTALARFSRVAIFDRRGCGLSDPLDAEQTIEAVVADILGVMAAAKMQHAVIVAGGETAPPVIRLAAEHPDRVEALVVFGGAGRMSIAPDYPTGKPAEFWASLESWITEHWGEALMTELFAPSASGDPSLAAWFATFLRLASSPRRAAAFLRYLQSVDERATASRVHVPTLVLRRRGDRAVSAERSRELANAIAGAKFLEIAGDDHFIYAGDGAAVAREIERFVMGIAKTGVVET